MQYSSTVMPAANFFVYPPLYKVTPPFSKFPPLYDLWPTPLNRFSQNRAPTPLKKVNFIVDIKNHSLIHIGLQT